MQNIIDMIDEKIAELDHETEQLKAGIENANRGLARS